VLGLHVTPDSFRLNQCPPAASAPAPGSHTSHQNGTCPGDFSLVRVAPGLFRQQVWRQFQSRDILRRHFQPHGILCFGIGLSTFDYVPVAERRMWVCTLPLIERGYEYRTSWPIRAPWLPFLPHQAFTPLGRCVATGSFGGPLSATVCHDSRRFPGRRPPPHGWWTLV